MPRRNQIWAFLLARRNKKRQIETLTSTIPTLTVVMCTRRHLRSCLNRPLSALTTAACFPMPRWISVTYAAKHTVANTYDMMISRMNIVAHRHAYHSKGHCPIVPPKGLDDQSSDITSSQDNQGCNRIYRSGLCEKNRPIAICNELWSHFRRSWGGHIKSE
jgi:hypothetical protein